jgi:ubiquinone/menaquinone biosynthesis C-methylase UbiE
MKLNLGSGQNYIQSYVNIDNNRAVKADVYFDLNQFPWPLCDNEYDEVLCSMVLEHLDSATKALAEVIRISRQGAKVTVIVPHAHSLAAVTDIQHRTSFTENSFTEGLLKEYGLEKLKLIKKEFVYKHEWKKRIPFKRALNVFLNGIYDDLMFEFEVQK